MVLARSRMGCEEPRGGDWEGWRGAGGGEEEEEEEVLVQKGKVGKELVFLTWPGPLLPLLLVVLLVLLVVVRVGGALGACAATSP